jgi:hypothetical protein
MERKIQFKDLSAGLKTSVVISYIFGVLYALYLLSGIIVGMLGG